MITENGTVKVNTVIDEKMQKEYLAKSNKLTLAMIIVGAVATLVFLILYCISDSYPVFEDGFTLPFLILFACLLGAAIGLKILFNKAVKQVKGCGKINEYEFFSDYFMLTQMTNGEAVATAKFYNSQITKVKDSKNYFFVYITAAQIFPVSKEGLTESELNILKTIFRLPVTAAPVTEKNGTENGQEKQ